MMNEEMIGETVAQVRAAVLKRIKEESEQMTLTEICEVFKKSRPTISRWIEKGEFPRPYYIAGSAYWDRRFVLQWIREKTRKANATADELLNYDPAKVW